MELRFILHKIRTTPFPVLVRRLGSRSWATAQKNSMALRDHLMDTHVKGVANSKPRLWLQGAQLDTSGLQEQTVAVLTDFWCAHRFDLLGSGWVRCGFLDNAPGIEGHRYEALILQTDSQGNFLEQLLSKQNVAAAKKIWSLIDDVAYEAIDWQKDFKSGYRWDARVWYRNQRWANLPGGDIKVPWELSRVQHFPRMAVFAWAFPKYRDQLFREFRNQCLDFIAQNPPRMGVNWHCTMDVGIRTANLVLAYWLFAAQGCSIDEAFTRIFTQSVWEHCHFIYHNLEWSEILTSNHYLGDITGLVFGAAFLPESTKQNKWLTFAAREVIQEIEKQFHEEGSNFEGSIAYHRLSSDMAVYSAALIEGMGLGALSQDLADRLYGAAKFLETVTRPDGRFVQLGDNDSGMFFRLSPTGTLCTAQAAKERYMSLNGYAVQTPDEPYYDEEINDPQPTISALYGLFNAQNGVGACALEKSLVAALRGEKAPHPTSWSAPKAMRAMESAEILEHEQEQVIAAPGEDLTQDLSVQAFPQFGVYILRSPRLFLLVNAADNGQKGNGGHAHNDKLSIELVLDGKVLAEDPGVYVYTALLEQRVAYQSVAAHATINTGVEQNDYLTPFAMKSESKCQLLSLSDHQICVEATYKGIRHRRTVEIQPDKIVLRDACNVPFAYGQQSLARTAGYGKLLYKRGLILS